MVYWQHTCPAWAIAPRPWVWRMWWAAICSTHMSRHATEMPGCSVIRTSCLTVRVKYLQFWYFVLNFCYFAAANTLFSTGHRNAFPTTQAPRYVRVRTVSWKVCTCRISDYMQLTICYYQVVHPRQTKNYHLHCLGLRQRRSGTARTGTVLCLGVAYSLQNQCSCVVFFVHHSRKTNYFDY